MNRRRDKMLGSLVALCLVVVVTLAIGSWVGNLRCAGLTHDQCQRALTAAQQILRERPDFIGQAGNPATRLTEVRNACPATADGEPSCSEEQEGFAAVRVESQTHGLGWLMVCIDRDRCGAQPPTFSFP